MDRASADIIEETPPIPPPLSGKTRRRTPVKPATLPPPPPPEYKGIEEEDITALKFDYTTRTGCFGWTKWIWFFIIGLYELACYHFVSFVDSRVNKTSKIADYATVYPRLGKSRKTPAWVPYFKAGLVFMAIIFFLLIHYFWYYLPAIGTVGDALFIDDRTRVIYLQEVLTQVEINDYIGDFARAPSFAAQRKQMNNATTTEQLDEIGSRWNSISRDGDGIGDQAQTDSWDWFAKHARVTGNGGTGFVSGATQSGFDWLAGTNYAANQRAASSATQQPIPVAPVLEFEDRVCGFLGQYQRKAGNIRLKKNNHDMTKLVLDLHNSFFTICKRIEDPTIHISATARGTDNIQRLAVLQSDCREHMAYITNARFNQDELPTICLSNVDFGIVEPFVYSVVFGQQSMYYINPRIIPLKATGSTSSSPPQQTTTTTENSHEDSLDAQRATASQNFFTFLDNEEPETTPVGKVDIAFWRHPGINTKFNIKMPRSGIAISSWTLPSQANLTGHYGDTFGSSLNSLINSRATIMEERKRQDALTGMSTFDESTSAYISSTIDYINSRSDDFTGLSLINGVVFDKRLEIDQMKAQEVKNAKAALDKMNAESTWGGFFSSERAKMSEILAKLEVQNSPLKLEYHEYISVPHPHHVCVVKGLTKNALLNRYRQIYADYMAGLGDTSSRYPMPRFPFITPGPQ